MRASQQSAQIPTGDATVASSIPSHGILKPKQHQQQQQQQQRQQPRYAVVPQHQVQSHEGVKGVKGVASSIVVIKRKREEDKGPKIVSKEEATALEAREAAKRRQIAREQKHLGLYSAF